MAMHPNIFDLFYREDLFSRSVLPSNNCERMKCATSSSFQYCKCAAIAERYEVSKSPSYDINYVFRGMAHLYDKINSPARVNSFEFIGFLTGGFETGRSLFENRIESFLWHKPYPWSGRVVLSMCP